MGKFPWGDTSSEHNRLGLADRQSDIDGNRFRSKISGYMHDEDTVKMVVGERLKSLIHDPRKG